MKTVYWYSKKIKIQILLRDKYLKQNLANPTLANKLRYTDSRNYANRFIKKEKYNSYNRKTESKIKQPRRFHRELNKLSGRNVTKDEVRIIEPQHNVVVRADTLAEFLMKDLLHRVNVSPDPNLRCRLKNSNRSVL